MKVSPIKSLALASAAALPMAGTAEAIDNPPNTAGQDAFAAHVPGWVPHVYISAEGGWLRSDYSRTSFPNGLSPAFVDSPVNFGFPPPFDGPSINKLGNCCVDDASSSSFGRNRGWYGALSLQRDIDPIWDWRLAFGIHSFGTNGRSSSLNQSGNILLDGEIPAFANSSRNVMESDRFSFATVDLDMGRKFQYGLLQTRAFAGLRAMSAEQRLNISDSEAKGLFPDEFEGFGFGAIRQTDTIGKSRFVGAGPRVGVEGFYGTTFGIVGSASAAFLVGWRESTFSQTQTSSPTFCIDPGFCIPFGEMSDSVNVRRTKFVGVGDLAGSLGVAWRPTPNHYLEAGYRTEYLINVQDSFNFANGHAFEGSGQFDQKKNVFMHGVYVKATLVY